MNLQLQEKQEEFLSSPADIAIGGGSAGGGKTYALLYEPLRHIKRPKFSSVMFRRSYAEITKMGGAWDLAKELYNLINADAKKNAMEFIFPSGARVGFGYLANDDTLDDWKSSQIALILFDQLETFTERMFFYMLSRNRSMCGIRPYIRATANPEPNWLADFLDWWIAPDGYADLDRAGKIRWFCRMQDDIIWADSEEELKEEYPESLPLSVTFIPFTIYDNPILMESNPGYLANLQGLSYVDRERLLGDRERGGNWQIKEGAGMVFNQEWFETVPESIVPEGGVMCRYFDMAGTLKESADYTAGVLEQYYKGATYVWDCINRKVNPAGSDEFIMQIARKDIELAKERGCRYVLRWEEEPGSASKRESAKLVKKLQGVDAKGVRKTQAKLVAWKPLAAQALAGNVILVEGAWNRTWVSQMHGLPDMPHDDIADASAGAYNELVWEAEHGERKAQHVRT